MTITITPRFQLPRWSQDTDLIERTQFDGAMGNIDALAAMDQQGPYSALPTAGTNNQGMYYYATDLNRLYRSNGSQWTEVLCHVDYHGSLAAIPAPGNPGNYYWADDQSRLFRDNGSQWVEILTQSLLPAGVIMACSNQSAPEGWLMCDGSSYSPSQYPHLFAAIAYKWGSQSNGYFNVPDFRNASLLGAVEVAGIGQPLVLGGHDHGSHIHPGHTHVAPVAPHYHFYVGSGSGSTLNTGDGVGVGPDTGANVYNGVPADTTSTNSDGSAMVNAIPGFLTVFEIMWIIKAV